jgi:hypothetical protein
LFATATAATLAGRRPRSLLSQVHDFERQRITDRLPWMSSRLR